jgi:hypothetical protein
MQCGDTDAGERHNGVCDKDGCDFNLTAWETSPFLVLQLTLLLILATTTFMVVTHFVTADRTDNAWRSLKNQAPMGAEWESHEQQQCDNWRSAVQLDHR